VYERCGVFCGHGASRKIEKKKNIKYKKKKKKLKGK